MISKTAFGKYNVVGYRKSLRAYNPGLPVMAVSREQYRELFEESRPWARGCDLRLSYCGFVSDNRFIVVNDED